MKLIELEIQTLPGIHPGFSVDAFDAGINLVVAPNAGGKSSLLRALNFLIAGVRQGDPAALALTAVFQDAETRWTVRRTGSSIVWERNGQPAEAPPLPAWDQLHCYWFSMEDLLSADARDENLLLELRRTLSGGFDLDAVLKQSEFTIGPRYGTTQASALTEAIRERRRIEADYKALNEEEARLPELIKKLEAADAASFNARALTQALSFMAARDERLQAESGLQTFPPNISRLRGDEITKLEELGNERKTISIDRDAKNAALQDGRQRLIETGLAEGSPEEAEFDARYRDIEEIRSKEAQKKSAIERLSAAGREVEHALTLLQRGANSTLPKLDPSSISQAETLACRIQKLTLERNEITARMPTTTARPDPREQAAVHTATEALRGWLNAGKASLWIPGLAACLMVAVAIFGFLAGVWIAGILAVIALLLIVWTLRPDGSSGFRKRYEETGMTLPGEWSATSVSEKLDELEMRRAELREAELQARESGKLAKRLADLEPELAEAETLKSAMSEKLGFDPRITALGLDRLVRLIADYEKAVRESDDAKASIAALEEDIGACRNRVNHFLMGWQVELPQDIDAALDGLRSRARKAIEAQREIVTATREIARAEEGLSRLDDQRTKLFGAAGILDGDVAMMTRCCEQLVAWKEQNEQCQAAKVREAERRLPLEENSDLLARVEASKRAELETELATAQTLADGATELRNQITRIETRRDEAGRDSKLEQASAGEQAARESLEDALNKVLYSDAAQFLMDGVRNEYRTGHEPELLQAAREQFSRFTHHAFRLQVDAEHGFTAFDNQQQATRKLSELSSGTRMQLLLAMRLAWTRKIEQRSVTLPLFLDEALTTSDEERFAQVVVSLEELASEQGRQIIYLSARRHEVGLWERAAGRRPHVIDLAAVRFGQVSTTPEDYRLRDIEPVPVPGSNSAEAYAAQLGVAPVDPLEEAGAIPVFYILRDDLLLLHRLLEDWSIKTVGQLRSLLNSEAGRHAVADAETRERLEGRCKVAAAWIDAWREGRGKPVGRIAIEQSSAVTSAFIDIVSELAAAHEGDAEAIIAALRNKAVRGFRSNSTDQLESWLQEQGYIDAAPKLSMDGRERRVLERTGGEAAPNDIRQVIRWLETGGKASDWIKTTLP